jgi:hypothetical protein
MKNVRSLIYFRICFGLIMMVYLSVSKLNGQKSSDSLLEQNWKIYEK